MKVRVGLGDLFSLKLVSLCSWAWSSPCIYGQQAEQNCWAPTNTAEINRNCRDVVTLRNSSSFFRSLLIGRKAYSEAEQEDFSTGGAFAVLFYFQSTKSVTLCQTGQVPGQAEKERRKRLSQEDEQSSEASRNPFVHTTTDPQPEVIVWAAHHWTLPVNRPSWGSQREKSFCYLFACVNLAQCGVFGIQGQCNEDILSRAF